MNEDITQEIYYCLIKAGYDEKRAEKLCSYQPLKMIFEHDKKEALEKTQSEFIDFLKKLIDYLS